MMRIQGILFCILSCVLAFASLFMSRLDQRTELIVIAVMIITLGVPHGALDTIFARQLYNLRSTGALIGFVAIYMLFSTATVGFWVLSPTLFLIGFFLISIAHFSGDPVPGTNLVTRILYGGAIIVLPALLHSSELSRLLDVLVGMNAMSQIMRPLEIIAWPWLVGLLIAGIWQMRINWLTAMELLSVSALAVFLPPLVAFTVFFCGMHSARHILRTFEYAGRNSPSLMVLVAIVPMVAVFGLSAIAWQLMSNTAFDTRLIQLIFVGLAALTVPHMVLVEQVRISGWIKGAERA